MVRKQALLQPMMSTSHYEQQWWEQAILWIRWYLASSMMPYGIIRSQGALYVPSNL